MHEFIEAQYDAEVIRWDEPTGDGDSVFEVMHRGRLIRADSLALILSALQDRTRRPVLAWTNIIAGSLVLPMRGMAA